MFHISQRQQTSVSSLRQKSISAFEELSTLHDKFSRQLVKYQNDKTSILEKMVSLSQAQETIMIDLCGFCEQANLLDLGKFIFKLHLQNMQVIRWIFSNAYEFTSKNTNNNCNCTTANSINKYFDQQKGADQHHNFISNLANASRNYYRIKENSLFEAQGIDYEIKRIQQEIKDHRKFQLQQFKNILNNKQIVQRIQASQNEKILFEAVDIISHHSEVFRKLTKKNKQAFIENYKQLNVKPFNILKAEVDQIMKQKISKANQQLMQKLDGFIKNRDKSKTNNKSYDQDRSKQIQARSYAVQVNFTKFMEQTYRKQELKKQQKIKQMTASINYHKTRAQKLQKLMREKANYFQQKLIKATYQKQRHNQWQAVKKSSTSIQHIVEDIHQQLQMLDDQLLSKDLKDTGTKKQKSIKFMLNNCAGNASQANNEKKSRLTLKQQCIYQKSLLRIKFDLNDSQNDQQDQQDRLRQIKQGFSICRQLIEYTYNPVQINKTHQKIREYREEKLSKLDYFPNTFDINFNMNQNNLCKSSSALLTIRNIKTQSKYGNDRRSRDSKRKSTIIHKTTNSSQLNRYSCKNININSKSTQRNIAFQQHPEIINLNTGAQNELHKEKKDIQELKSKFASSNCKMKLSQGNMIYFTSKMNSQESQTIKNTQQDKKLQNINQNQKQDHYEQTSKLHKRKSRSGDKENKIKNNFQMLNLDDNYLLNKKKLTLMVSQLKKKRKHRCRQKQLANKSNKLSCINFQRHFEKQTHSPTIRKLNKYRLNKQVIQKLYINEQNAMQAELQFGVSVSTLVAQRKYHKDKVGTSCSVNKQNEQYYEQMAKKIQILLYQVYKRQINYFYQLQFGIKCPLSYLKGNFITVSGKNKNDENQIEKSDVKLRLKEDLTIQDISNFIKFISNLHRSCQRRPCSHLSQFLRCIAPNFNYQY